MQILSKDEVEKWLNRLLNSYCLVAPTQVNDIVRFHSVSQIDQIVWDYGNSYISPKEFLFPKTQPLFSIESQKEEVTYNILLDNQRTIIFGIRPCDAKAFSLLDKPFLESPADTYWKNRREHTILIGMACNTPAKECFCTSMGTSPIDAQNVDILLQEINNQYSVTILSDKGRSITQECCFEVSENLSIDQKKPLDLSTSNVVRNIQSNFDSSYWQDLAQRCIHCNVCSYICPTCYCFDIRDVQHKGETQRVRTWESCQSKEFSRIAGGHDPRTQKGNKLRQRFAHKLLYFYQQFGSFGCVGCGRCIRACPVNIDIREVISDLNEE